MHNNVKVLGTLMDFQEIVFSHTRVWWSLASRRLWLPAGLDIYNLL